MHKLTQYFFIAALMVLAGGLQSCSKTEQIDFEKEPLTRILEFRISNVQQDLFGAIDQKENTITVYVPYYLGIEYLNPVIKVDEGATLFDGAGQPISLESIDPVPVGDTARYMVKNAEGMGRTYTLLQKVLPHGDPLNISYVGSAAGIDFVKPVNSRLSFLGNFESTSTNIRFLLTNKATGKTHDNYISPVAITPGSPYNLLTYVSPDAVEGDYDVKVIHQGRETSLPTLKLKEQKTVAGGFFSSALYGTGDTIRFATSVADFYDAGATVFREVKKAYIKIKKGTLVVPAGFPESLYNTQVEMRIVSQSRTELVAIFPQLPSGQYTGNGITAVSENNHSRIVDADFAFYVDFADNTGWGVGHLISCISAIRFTVK